jgi:hypothetical protein
MTNIQKNEYIEKLNQMNEDGSVNSFQETKKLGHGYSIKITHPKFKTQIEPGIWPHIVLLISKGYVTVTSCQGHGLINLLFNNGIRRNRGPQITVSIEDNIKFRKELNSWMISCKANPTMKEVNYISIQCRYSFLPNNIQRFFIYKALLKL